MKKVYKEKSKKLHLNNFEELKNYIISSLKIYIMQNLTII